MFVNLKIWLWTRCCSLFPSLPTSLPCFPLPGSSVCHACLPCLPPLLAYLALLPTLPTSFVSIPCLPPSLAMHSLDRVRTILSLIPSECSRGSWRCSSRIYLLASAAAAASSSRLMEGLSGTSLGIRTLLSTHEMVLKFFLFSASFTFPYCLYATGHDLLPVLMPIPQLPPLRRPPQRPPARLTLTSTTTTTMVLMYP
jgi:hypothetical protein